MELAMATSSLVTGGLRTTSTAAADRRRRCWMRTRPVQKTASVRGARQTTVVSAAAGGCKTCKGKGAVECPGCKGSGKNKKNGNIFERWMELPGISDVLPWSLVVPLLDADLLRGRGVSLPGLGRAAAQPRPIGSSAPDTHVSGASIAKDLGSRAALAVAKEGSHPSREGRDR